VATTGGTASVEPEAIRAHQVAEVTLIPELSDQERTLEVIVHGQRDTAMTVGRLDVLTHMPGVDQERGAFAAEVRDRFVPWLAEHHPELGITSATEWRGTVVIPQVLVVMHYLFFSAEWEMHVEWHIVIPPYDWARIDLRRRLPDWRPSRAFEISSWANETEPIEIEPPESIWR
jgi:hypothetical protein